MALQVRLRHALGERLLELPERGIADPLVVGRARDGDVQVPSIRVLAQHCVLFVHEGLWVVQAMGGVTRVNGRLISGPTTLNIGDLIEIGDEASPPSLEVDPAGVSAGRKGSPATVTPGVADLSPQVSTQRWTFPVPASVARAGSAAPSAYPPSLSPAEEQGGPVADPDQIGWSPSEEGGHWSRPSYSLRRSGKPSGVAKGIGIVVGLAAIGGAAFLTYRRINQPVASAPQHPVTTRPTIVEDDAPQLHSKLFSGAGERAALPSGTAATTQPDVDLEPGRPKGADATWDDVVARHYEVTRQGPAIVAFDEYRRLRPGQFDKELDRYTDDAINWIWWQRIEQLCTQRDHLINEIRKKKQDIHAQPAGSFHDRLVKEQADLEAQLAKIRQILTVEMGYTDESAPDVKNPAQLKELAKRRDAAKYAAFRSHILAYVRNHHGELPWEGG